MRPLELTGLVTSGNEASWAVTSPCGLYRYALGRMWDEPGEPWRPMLDVCMLNPSKARHDINDPTILKLIHFGKQEGCGGLVVRNLAAFSSTDPSELSKADDPVGPRNIEVLGLDNGFALRIAAWGNFPSNRVRRRLAQARGWWMTRTTLHVFGINGTGEPKHPLYLKNSTRAVRWS